MIYVYIYFLPIFRKAWPSFFRVLHIMYMWEVKPRRYNLKVYANVGTRRWGTRILLLYRLKASIDCGRKIDKYLKLNIQVWATQERILPRNSIPVIQTTNDHWWRHDWRSNDPILFLRKKGFPGYPTHIVNWPRSNDEDLDRLNLVAIS